MDLDCHKREDAAFAAYFSHIIGELPEVTGVTAVCIAHMVSNSRHFLPAVDAMAPVGLVLPKPNSKNPKVFEEIQHRFRTDELSRDWARNAEHVVDTFQRHNLSKKRLIIIDIGGYFASSIGHVAKLFDGEICGVVEGTENGAQKYEGPGHFTDLDMEALLKRFDPTEYAPSITMYSEGKTRRRPRLERAIPQDQCGSVETAHRTISVHDAASSGLRYRCYPYILVIHSEADGEALGRRSRPTEPATTAMHGLNSAVPWRRTATAYCTIKSATVMA